MSLNKMLCQIRQEWVSDTPEEKIRQRLLRHMLEKQKYPRSLIAVEKGLRQMPHLSLADQSKIPNRRFDIICFGKGQNQQLNPLLVVECKAVAITVKMRQQVIGYNHFLQSKFICLASPFELITGWWDKASGDYIFIDHLPSYEELVAWT